MTRRRVGNPDDYLLPPSAIDDKIAHALNEGVTLVRAEIAALVQRLDDMARANEILSDTVNRTPTLMQTEIGHVRELMARDISAVNLRFEERDRRFDIQNRDAKAAIETAFASTSALSQQQEAANNKAIEKAEHATNETINKNAEVIDKQLNAIRDMLSDVKDRVGALEAEKRGVREHGFDQRAVITLLVSVIVAVIVVASFVIAITAHSTPGG